jgi:alpha-1,2-rhamnosyltransferase
MKTPVVTGIQRVVRNLIRHGRIAARDSGLDLVPIRFTGESFDRVNLNARGDLPAFAPAVLTMQQRVLIRLKKIFINRRLDRQIKKLREVLSPPPAPAAGFEFRQDDILLLPDSSWTENMWDAVDRARSGGLVLGVLQHDFIPVRQPQLVPETSTVAFQRWMTESLSRADFILAVSNAVAEECREELRSLGRHRIADERVGVCPNGANFKSGRVPGAVRAEVSEFVRGAVDGPYLTIGTIEPRKNQTLVLEALDDVLEACPTERFLIAGIVGWRGNEIAERIRAHRRYGTNVMLVENLSDAELDFAYKNAKAVVFPSLAEGFGLPIVEAMARGTRVFASGIPVHREVGAGACVYFDPGDARQLGRVLIEYSRYGRFPATWPAPDFRIPTWQAAAQTMVTTAARHAREIRGASGHGAAMAKRAS